MTKNNLKVVKSTKDQETDNKEKNKALDAAIAQITDNFGKGSVMKLGEKRAMDIESISTGSLSLDLALGIGGLPKGRIVEVYTKQDLSTNRMDFKILKMPAIKRDQNLLTSLRTGVYNVRIQTKNLLTGEFTDNVVNLLDKDSTYLGNKPSVKAGQNEKHLENYCKTYSYVLTPGSVDEGVGTEITNNPALYEPQAHMRYAMLHSQVVDIEIPCNVRLMAGNVIKLMIENVTGGIKQDNKNNEHRSGFYVILHLCHHFDPHHSRTYLTLARDTYGLYTSTK